MFSATFFAHLGYALLVSAYFMRNIFYLRVLSMTSATAMLIYSLTILENPIWINVIWDGLFLAVNSVQISILIYEWRELKFNTEEERELYQHVFNSLTPGQFRKLLRYGLISEVEKGKVLTKQNHSVKDIFMLIKGLASVDIDGTTIAYCRTGNFIGEMSLLTNKPASATVTCIEDSRYIRWPQKKLKDLLRADPEINRALQVIFNAELIRKLAKSS